MVGTTNAKALSMLEQVSTPELMNAKLTAANVGHAYIYTGTTTADYENGTIYVVEVVGS